ncbi:MAG: DHHA2 domain-containing protein [Verrucomicrobiota bacterium]
MPEAAPHYIVGHKNPDSDSIVCAHVLAWLHRQIDPDSNATAIRLGEVNRQSAWLFEQAGCELPALRKSCQYTAAEIAQSAPVVDSNCSLREALERMQRASTDFIAVVDHQNRPLGIVSDRTQRTNYLLQCNIEDFIGTLLDFEHIVSGLPLEPLGHSGMVDIQRLEVPIHKSTVLGNWDNQTAIIIGDRELFLDTVKSNPPGAVIITGVETSRAKELAQRVNCPAYCFSGSVISMLTRLPGCFPASAAMVEDYIAIDESMKEDELGRSLKNSDWGLMVLDDEGRVSGAISAIDILNLKRPRISLVDHSERGQSIDGLQDAEVVEIIDHHRLGDIETIQPLHIDVRPLGSTASILYERILETEVELPPYIAKLLLGALIADTLLLTSPTCAESDKTRARKLAETAQVNLQAYGIEVLKQNDELASAPAEALVRRDCKRFNFEGVSFLAAQIETVDMSALSDQREQEIEDAFSSVIHADDVDFGVIMITDVLASRSRIILVSDDEKWPQVHLPAQSRGQKTPWIEEAFVSRKKQLIPLLLNNINNHNRDEPFERQTYSTRPSPFQPR